MKSTEETDGSFSFQVDLERGMVRKRIRGHWDLEIAREYFGASQVVLDKMMKRPNGWVFLVDVTQEVSDDPGVFPVLADAIDHFVQNGLKWMAIVVPDEEREMKTRELRSLCKRGNIIKTFYDRELAEKWLIEKGF